MPDREQGTVLQRLAPARELLGTQDPLDCFLTWKTLDERYRPRSAAKAEEEES